MTTLAAFADEIEALTAGVEQRLRALAVCLSVISHKDTDPKTAGQIFGLQQWIAREGRTR